ncbi:MAG TPA: hypothetical protein VFJ87_08270 [Rhodanobacteraceae bacterium]|nr:hypothetical protein [Rhodanobacteraceae bacterium]
MSPTVVIATLYSRLQDGLSPARKALRDLRLRWGKPGDRDGWLARDFFDHVADADASACIDDKTWTDLEFPKIFASIDACITPLGSQVLYRWMRTLNRDTGALASRHAVYRALQSDAAAREKLERALLPLRNDDDARIANFIFGALPPPLPQRALLVAWSLASIVVLAGVIAWSWPMAIWIVMAFVNVAILARVCGRALAEVEMLKRCLVLIDVANALAALAGACPSVRCLAGLRDERGNRAAVRNALRLLAFLKRPVISYGVVWLNFAFLLEPLVHMRALAKFARLRSRLAASFELVGEVDATLAIASWLDYAGRDCPPKLVDAALLDIRDGRHPLLVDGVANSVRLDGQSALVTGSNMAGKTTFIKMLGVNVLLGQTLGFCLASAATIPRACVMASIQAAHSIAAGKSHYFSEVETIQSFLAAPSGTGGAIFVIDELFSGTNTVERVAIARAVLETLGRNGVVLATTHDVELQGSLGDCYRLFHFQESPEVDGYFDYTLRAGPATERNAIRLLRELGFPGEVIAPAMRYAAQDAEAAAQTG